VATVHADHPRSAHTSRARIAEAYSREPLGFEANRGQVGAAGGDVQFVSRGAGYALFLTSTEAALALRRSGHERTERAQPTLLRMKLVESNPSPRVAQTDELPGRSHYIIGRDPRNWHTQVPRYARVKYEDVYPGVDLVYYGNQQQLEFDFIVAPGADPDAIELAFEGCNRIRVDNGDLLLESGGGEVRLKAPVIYQEIDGRRVEIPGGYSKTGSDRVAFRLGAYDSSKPLVVDPIVVFSTYLGGSSQDLALGIAVGYDGVPYITGYTASIDFPTTGAHQPACATNVIDGYPYCEDAFITKLGSYSTYLGGTSVDVATGIAVRRETGEAYVTGWTRSPDFPTANAIDAVFGEDPSRERAFAARLSPDGSELVYSTYLGDEPWAHANAVAVDADGAAYVTGSSIASYAGPDVFVTKLTPDGSAVSYSNRFGGSGSDVGYGIAVDDQGYASVTGATDSPDFPRLGSFWQPSGGFAVKLVPDGSGFVYSTYLFGTGTGLAIAGPYTYVTGVMPGRFGDWSSPAGPGGGRTDAFVEVLEFGGQVSNFTHLGGTGDDRGSQIGVDSRGNVWVAGVTTSTDFPLRNPLQGQVHDLDAFVVKFNRILEPVFATYLGGSGREQLISEIESANLPGPPGPALAVDWDCVSLAGCPGGVAWIAGFTDSTDFPTSGLLPAPQPAPNGPVNTFVTALFDDGVATKPDLAVADIAFMSPEAELGATLHYLFQVTNKGPARATDVWFVDKLPPGAIVDQVFLATPSTPGFSSIPRTCNHDSMWVACRIAWTLSQGESVFVAIDARPTTAGPQINTAAVVDQGESSHAFGYWIAGFNQDLIWGEDASRDSDIKDNSVTTTTVMNSGSADLSVTGSASPDVVMLDGTLTYTIDVENHGPAANAAATLTDTLPAGSTLISVTQTGSVGSCTGTSVFTCHWPSLSGIAQVTIVVRASAPGTLTNTAVVSGTASDPDSNNNAVTLVTGVNRPPAASAGPDQIVSAGATCQAIVTLNGTGSSDPDGDALTYTWTIDNLLPPPILSSPAAPSTGVVTGSTPSGPLPVGTHTITLTVDDGHGGTSSDTVVVTVRDVTAPTFSGVPAPVTIEQSSPSGTPYAVAIPTASDGCSGSVAVSSDAPATLPRGVTIVTFTARDAAGNSATATTTATVVDTVAPALTIASPQARVYLHSDVLTTSFAATDDGSGLAAGSPSATLDGAAVANAQSISMLTMTLGTHSFVVGAADLSGNSRGQTVTFEVIATIDSLIASVNTFTAQNKIDDASIVRSLLAKLNDARDLMQRGKKAAAIDKLQGFIDQVTAQRERHISADAAQILVADAQYVIGTL
jgi:uncharacterized repeat protein (TIGR01451 family)